MDTRLVAWARRVKARRAGRVKAPPPLWLFTDPARTPDLERAVLALPRGLCGVVFRHDSVPGRASLARRVAALCRRRGIQMVVAEDWRLAARVGAGLHLRGGRRSLVRTRGLLTSSAHGKAELVRALRAGAGVVFLSPVFATVSHPGGRALGPLNWARLAASSPATVYALGGIAGDNIGRLPRWCAGCAGIGGMVAQPHVSL